MCEIRRGCQIKPQCLFRRAHMYHNYCARTRPSTSVSIYRLFDIVYSVSTETEKLNKKLRLHRIFCDFIEYFAAMDFNAL